MNPNALLIEQAKPVLVNVPALGSGAGTYLSLKNYEKVTFLIGASNGGAGVTGSVITLKQALAVAGTGEKPIPFTKAYRNLDLAVNQQLAEFAVAADTFTLDATVSKNLFYAIEVDLSQLDVKNDFDCVKLVAGTSVAQTLAIVALLWPGKIQKLASPSPLVD
jgi:hypothetical protein